MKRKIIIFLIVFFIIVGIIALSLVSKPVNQIGNIVPGSKPPVKSPQITTFYSNKGIDYKINVKDFEPPKELPLIKVTPPRPLTDNEVFFIAKTAGLDEQDYNKIYNAEGDRLYIFSSNNAYLTVYADSGELSYKNYSGVSDNETKLSENEIVSKAKDLLASKFSFRKDVLSLSSINHFDNDNYLTKPDPSRPRGYFEVNFAPVITDYKVVTTDPNKSPIKVTVADDGTIGKADITLVYNGNFSSEKYALLSFNDLKDNVDQAIIVHAFTEDFHGQAFPMDSITSIDINSIEIAYLAESNRSGYYQPVFLLEGTAKSNNTNAPITATLYLPALKDQNK